LLQFSNRVVDETMTHTVAPELAFAQELSGHLSKSGRVNLQYATAEMQPFSNAQRPDILFIPSGGPYAGSSVFVEIKLSTRRMTTGLDYQLLADHLEFAEEYIDGKISKYIFITSDSVPEFSKKSLAKMGVHAVDRVETIKTALSALNEILLL
jgi:hypothetical protein